MKPKIAVPFDFSDGARVALAWAADLHRTAGGEPIRMIHAVSCLPLGSLEAPLQPLMPTAEEIAELSRRMVEIAATHEVVAVGEVAVRASPVGDAILDAAAQAGAELIVMGTHGRTGVRRLVLGSVAEYVLRHAECPVVTVRAHRAK